MRSEEDAYQDLCAWCASAWACYGDSRPGRHEGEDAFGPREVLTSCGQVATKGC